VSGVHPQLQAIAEAYEIARLRLQRLVAAVPPGRWSERPQPTRWSIAECVAHLNLTTAAYRPLVEAALVDGRERAARTSYRQGGSGQRMVRYRRGWVGWMLWRTAGPPVRFRVKTTAPFVPQSTAPPAELVAEFERLQDEQQRWVTAADGLDLEALRIPSPFVRHVHYNLYACLTLLPRHQHRHLWQAEQVWKSLRDRQPNYSAADA